MVKHLQVSGDIAAMALDLDNGTWEMFIDGIPTGTIYSGISGTYTVCYW